MTTKMSQKNKYLPQPLLLEKVAEMLIEKLGASQASEFWSYFVYGKDDYLKIKKKIFHKETVHSLYKKIKAFKS